MVIVVTHEIPISVALWKRVVPHCAYRKCIWLTSNIGLRFALHMDPFVRCVVAHAPVALKPPSSWMQVRIHCEVVTLVLAVYEQQVTEFLGKISVPKARPAWFSVHDSWDINCHSAW